MVFKSKVQIAAEAAAKAAIIPGTGNESVTTVKKEKKISDAVTDVKAQRELYEKNQEIEELKKELESARNQPKPEVTQAPGQDAIEQMRAQINTLTMQVLSGAQGKKLLFRTPTTSDLAKDSITFTARNVYYIVGSYIDRNGLEKLPPFKLIPFLYAASDIVKDGKEETIKNFSQYTTNLQPEIDFLRGHPYYGITFSENTNEMMNEDVKETEFRLQAANQLTAAAPEEIFARARELNIPNYMNKSAHELKPFIIAGLTAVYKKQAQQLADDIIRRQFLANAAEVKKE